MSSGCAAQTASMPSSSSMRPDFVAMLRRIQVAAVWPSSFAAFGASQGAFRGTCRASRLSRRCACSHVDEHDGVDARDRARVAAHAAAVLEHVVARWRGWGTSRRRARAASAASRSCVGPIHCPPTSTTLPSPRSWFSTRPPTRSRASSTTTEAPAALSARAAARPASPAPTTTTSASRVSGSATNGSLKGNAAPGARGEGEAATLLRSHASRNSPVEREEERRLNLADADDRERRVGHGGRRHLAALDRRHVDCRGAHPCPGGPDQRGDAPPDREDRPRVDRRARAARPACVERGARSAPPPRAVSPTRREPRAVTGTPGPVRVYRARGDSGSRSHDADPAADRPRHRGRHSGDCVCDRPW